jgi:hypothetical protein
MHIPKNNAHTVKAQMVNEKWWVGNYRHAMPFPNDNLYRRIRAEMKLTQKRAAALFGITEQAWRYRERMKRMYHLAEILALLDASGMSHKDFIKLMSECA